MRNPYFIFSRSCSAAAPGAERMSVARRRQGERTGWEIRGAQHAKKPAAALPYGAAAGDGGLGAVDQACEGCGLVFSSTAEAGLAGAASAGAVALAFLTAL